MEKDPRISLSVIKRLPRYYRYLGELLDSGIDRISSKELSMRMDLTASQIRQDLNNFGCFGQQGYGYNVVLLHNEIKKILGLNQDYKLIIIGMGNLGHALCNYTGFHKRGFHFVGLFDVDPKLIGTTVGDLAIQDVYSLDKYLAHNTIDIAVLTLPKANAPEAVQLVIENGVKGIWNFSNIDLQTPEDVVVENVHLSDSLMTLSYQLSGTP